MIKCEHEKDGKCELGIKTMCAFCDYLIPVGGIEKEKCEVKQMGSIGGWNIAKAKSRCKGV